MLKPDKIIFNSRLILEPLLESHAQVLYDLMLDETIYKYIPDKPPSSIEALRSRYARLEHRISPSGNELWLNWAVKLKDTNQYLGTVQATVDTNNSASIAYVFGVNYWGKGFALEACELMIKYLISEYKIVKINAEVDLKNLASQNLLQKLGFKQIGINTENGDFLYEFKK